jgi:hypothetical protein
MSGSGNKIFATTAPSSGAIVLSTLKIFEGLEKPVHGQAVQHRTSHFRSND